MRAEEHTTSWCIIHEVKQHVSGTWVSSGCSPSTGPRLGSSSSRCRINLLFLRDAPMFEQLSRLRPEQNCWEPEGKWIPAPSRNTGGLCLVWFLRKVPHQYHCWVINACSMQVSGPGGSHHHTWGFPGLPPGRQVSISPPLLIVWTHYWEMIEKLRPFFATTWKFTLFIFLWEGLNMCIFWKVLKMEINTWMAG